jgi:hypothetical protein
LPAEQDSGASVSQHTAAFGQLAASLAGQPQLAKRTDSIRRVLIDEAPRSGDEGIAIWCRRRTFWKLNRACVASAEGRQEGRTKELVAGHRSLEVITSGLLSVRAVPPASVGWLREAAAVDRAHRYAGTAADEPRRGRHRRTHLCLRDRRPVTIQIVEGRSGVFRHDANAISVRGNRLQRPNFKQRGRLTSAGTA